MDPEGTVYDTVCDDAARASEDSRKGLPRYTCHTQRWQPYYQSSSPRNIIAWDVATVVSARCITGPDDNVILCDGPSAH